MQNQILLVHPPDSVSASVNELTNTPQHVHWLGQAVCSDPALVGTKAANLSRLASHYPVPVGFCLSAHASDHHTYFNQETILQAYVALEQIVGQPEPSVAVRSSGVDEDGASASFAGQYETFLNVRGAGAVLAAVDMCLHSAFAPRALDYRLQNGLNRSDIRLAVLVQQLVPADVSAVIFSANPITGRRDEIVITASWGLGESIVGGTVTPDTYTVGRKSTAEISAQISEKARMTVPTPSGTTEVTVPRLLRTQRTLTDAQLLEMAEMATALENEMGYAVDLECAWHGGKLYLLQCRPITTALKNGLYTRLERNTD
ncbi:MAG: PEP/pyruvate-binding domain-containing protein [Caldilineaceae bacterium]|nr:PEP/pyruvate-binding domain-containing protein [Caldilineaceae bacterium]